MIVKHQQPIHKMLKSSSWIVKHSYAENIQNTIICFPYAGGSSQVFARWEKFLPKNINILSVQYPGRLGLAHLPPKTDVMELVRTLYGAPSKRFISSW